MEKRGFIFDLMDELENNANIHRGLLIELEKKTQRTVVFYHANMSHPMGLMLDHDAETFEDILRTLNLEKYDKKLDLAIHSPGGLPEVAAKFVKIARSYSTHFRVVVPSTAMSAATLMAMGADQIVMSDTSKLGPIDPQMQTINKAGQPIRRPAKSFIDAYESLIEKAHEAIAAQKPPQAFFALLNNEDPSWIRQCIQARDATKRLATQLLTDHMLQGKSEQVINDAATKFFDAGDEGTHGSPIYWEQAKQFGLKIHHEDKNTPAWKLTRELFIRLERYVGAKGQAKYFLCNKGGVDVNVQLKSL
jgi:ATP-dependent protease ClpP protease subunit